MPRIDWERLGDIEDGNHGWRTTLSHPGKGEVTAYLSHVYVAGEGDNPEAFIIGEAPGATEEAKRRPFVGVAGVAMRDLMALAGLYATDTITLAGGESWPVKPNCWLTNVVKFRPPRNRKPTSLEIKAARPFLRQEWEAVGKPALIIPVGGTALEAVLGKPQSILRAAGKCHKATSREGKELFIWPMVHPSFALRTPAVQPLLEADWERLAEWREKHG